MTGHTLTRRAHAKVNLALAVGPPDAASAPPGMHPIASWMAPIDLADTLTLRRLAEGEASRHGIAWAADAPRPSPIDWPLERDLAVRAHALLEGHAGRRLPVAVRVEKRTPVGGGLGGGSSDGAAALLALDELFGLGLGPRRLARLSAPLGSDVAFFLDGPGTPAPAIVTGFGDRVERVGKVPGRLLLIFPPFGCPTGPVYKAFDASPPGRMREDEVRALAGAAIGAGRIDGTALFNDLAEPAGAVAPGLGPIRRAAAAALGLAVHVTGSGSTLFAVLSGEGAAEGLGAARAALPGVSMMVARLC